MSSPSFKFIVGIQKRAVKEKKRFYIFRFVEDMAMGWRATSDPKTEANDTDLFCVIDPDGSYYTAKDHFESMDEQSRLDEENVDGMSIGFADDYEDGKLAGAKDDIPAFAQPKSDMLKKHLLDHSIDFYESDPIHGKDVNI